MGRSAGHCGRHEDYRCIWCERYHPFDYHSDWTPGEMALLEREDGLKADLDRQTQIASDAQTELEELRALAGTAVSDYQRWVVPEYGAVDGLDALAEKVK